MFEAMTVLGVSDNVLATFVEIAHHCDGQRCCFRLEQAFGSRRADVDRVERSSCVHAQIQELPE